MVERSNYNGRRKKDSVRLVWDSKPRRAPNPRDIEFQTAEVVIPNPGRDEAQIPLSFKDGLFGEEELHKQKMNRLIWGDNLLAMQALLAQGYEGKISLIYIDPPFYTGEDLSYTYSIEGNEVEKPPSIIERLAYVNRWSGGIDSFLDFMHPRLHLMKRLLAEDGMIFVRFDYHVGHYIKILLDEIFGKERFVNEIVVNRICKKGFAVRETFKAAKYPVSTDSLFLYSKTDKHFFEPCKIIKEGQKEKWHSMDVMDANPSTPKPRIILGREMLAPPGRKWMYSQENIYEMEKRGLIKLNARGKPIYKVKSQGFELLDSNWTDIPGYSFETGYPTENAKALLQRVVKTGSKPGDLIADFFCGSSTTLVVAEEMGRRWIGCDLGKVAIQITRSRLVEQEARPFLIENIGNYQREMIYLTGGRIGEMQSVILKLYGATPRKDTADLGTRKAENGITELVYVGYPDRPVTAKKVEELAKQAEKLDGTGYRRLVVLAWDYEYNYSRLLEERLKGAKERIKTEISSRSIPPDIYEYLKKVKNEEDIEPLRGKVQFYGTPYLKLAEPRIKKASNDKYDIIISLDKYVLFDIPVKKEEEKQKLMKIAKDNFAVLIDYWAVDWDYDGHTFKSTWQDFRGNGRKTRVVTTKASKDYDKGKRYKVAVRVVDVFGNDATATVDIDLRK